jgi:hypothetical protein
MAVHRIEAIGHKEPSRSKRLGKPEINTKNLEHVRLLIPINGQNVKIATTVRFGHLIDAIISKNPQDTSATRRARLPLFVTSIVERAMSQ